MRTTGSRNQKTPQHKHAILDAALVVFGEHGYERATLDQICARIGVTKGSLYHHFASKEAIARALYDGAVSAIHRAVLDVRDEPLAPRPVIEGIVRAYLGWFERNPALGAFVFDVMDRRFTLDAASTFSAQRELIDAAAARFARWARRGLLRRLPSALYVALTLGPARTFLRAWLPRRRRADMRAAKRELPLAAWKSLAPSID